ncbi:MAG: hypothetical protein F4Y76_07395 [Acidimicrobiales bacterium]|nr:hypothetical protein [Acidimicrobiaceae bacterium]MDE0678446.1 hypothetical protein [Acidimicrobiaceae bacterium]MXZ15324.1 hypothetical protein [Acidimicrobiales bacterium]
MSLPDTSLRLAGMRRSKIDTAKQEIIAGLRNGSTWQDAVWGATIDLGTVRADKWRQKDPEFDNACWDAAVSSDTQWRAANPQEADKRDEWYRVNDINSSARFRTLSGTMTTDEAAEWASQQIDEGAGTPLSDLSRDHMLSSRLGLRQPAARSM